MYSYMHLLCFKSHVYTFAFYVFSNQFSAYLWNDVLKQSFSILRKTHNKLSSDSLIVIFVTWYHALNVSFVISLFLNIYLFLDNLIIPFLIISYYQTIRKPPTSSNGTLRRFVILYRIICYPFPIYPQLIIILRTNYLHTYIHTYIHTYNNTTTTITTTILLLLLLLVLLVLPLLLLLSYLNIIIIKSKF